MQFKTGDLVRHKWAYGENVYILLEENCGSPIVIGSNRGFSKVKFLFSGTDDPHYTYRGDTIMYVARTIIEREWCYAEEEEE